MAEALVRDLVAQVRHCQKAEKDLRQLLTAAFADLPASAHVQVVTIPGIGAATAAVLVAKIVDIDRFATPDQLVGYFGIFPEENSSGVDKQGNPLPPGTMHMSPQRQRSGALLPLECRPGRHPPQPRHPRPLSPPQGQGQTRRRRLGHCMRKLLHLVFAVWKTDRPFDEKHFPWENPGDAPLSTTTPGDPSAACNTRRQRRSRGPQAGRARERSGHHGRVHRRARGLSCQAGDAADRGHAAQGGLRILASTGDHGTGA